MTTNSNNAGGRLGGPYAPGCGYDAGGAYANVTSLSVRYASQGGWRSDAIFAARFFERASGPTDRRRQLNNILRIPSVRNSTPHHIGGIPDARHNNS